jgi:hypothetical protein
VGRIPVIQKPLVEMGRLGKALRVMAKVILPPATPAIPLEPARLLYPRQNPDRIKAPEATPAVVLAQLLQQTNLLRPSQTPDRMKATGVISPPVALAIAIAIARYFFTSLFFSPSF